MRGAARRFGQCDPGRCGAGEDYRIREAAAVSDRAHRTPGRFRGCGRRQARAVAESGHAIGEGAGAHGRGPAKSGAERVAFGQERGLFVGPGELHPAGRLLRQAGDAGNARYG